jgi:enoyl-CoA hydratase
MEVPVTYSLQDRTATITMDDGKVNVMSLTMQRAINAALDRAENDRAVVLITGRPTVFSAGFDLKVLQAGGPDSVAMVRGGFELAARLLVHPYPVVMACPGHAIAMGAFVLLSGDYRLGASGDYKIVANEVAIGLTMPRAATEIMRQRLTPATFNRALILSEAFAPNNAVAAGFLDRVVPAEELLTTAQEVAASMASLDMKAHAASKRRARAGALEAIHAGIVADAAAW